MSFHFYNQWQPLFGGSWNWIDFTILNLSFEWGSYKGRYLELSFIILGLGFELSWVERNSRAVFLADMDQRIAEAKEQLDIQPDDDAKDVTP